MPGPREGASAAASYHIGGETLPPGFGRPPGSPFHYARDPAGAAGLQGAACGGGEGHPLTGCNEQALQSSGGAGAAAVYGPHSLDMGLAANSAVGGGMGGRHYGHHDAEAMAVDGGGASGFPGDGGLLSCDDFMEDEDAAGWLRRSFHGHDSTPYN